MNLRTLRRARQSWATKLPPSYALEGDKLTMYVRLSKRSMRDFRAGELKAHRRAQKRFDRRVSEGKYATLRLGRNYVIVSEAADFSAAAFNQLSLTRQLSHATVAFSTTNHTEGP